MEKLIEKERDDDIESLSDPLLPQSPAVCPPKHNETQRKGIHLTFCNCFWIFLFPVFLVFIQWIKFPIAAHVLSQTTMSFDSFRLSHPTNHSVLLSSRVSIPLHPASTFLSISIASLDASIGYNGESFGTLHLPPMALSLSMNKINISQILYISNFTCWNDFSTAMIQKKLIKWTLEGNLRIHILYGFISINNVPLHQVMTMKGMQGLQSLEISDLKMNASNEQEIKLTILACLYNPSQVMISPVGNHVSFEAFLNSTGQYPVVSPLIGKNLRLVKSSLMPSDTVCRSYGTMGYNAITLSGVLVSPEKNQDSITIIQHYTQNRSTSIEVRACHGNAVTDVVIYQKAMETFQVTCQVKGLQQPLVSKLDVKRMELNPETLLLTLDSHVRVMNPLGLNSPLKLYNPTTLHLWFTFSGFPQWNPIGHLSIIDGSNIFPNGSILNHSLYLNLKLQLDHIPFTIDHMSLWTTLMKDILSQQYIPMHIHGKCNLWTNILAFSKPRAIFIPLVHLPLSFDMKWKGMHNFSQSNITIDHFSLSSMNRRISMSITTQLYNPSIFSIPLVELTFTVWNQKIAIGMITTTIPMLNATGWNTLQFNGQFDPPRDIPHYPQNLNPQTTHMFSRYVRHEKNPIVIRFHSMKTNQSWFRQAFEGLELTTDLPGVETNYSILPADEPLHLCQMKLQFEMKKDIELSFHVKGRYQLPPSLHHMMNFTLVSLDGLMLDFYYQNEYVGQFEFPFNLPMQSTSRHEFELSLPHMSPLSLISFPIMSNLITQIMFGQENQLFQFRLASTSMVNPILHQTQLGMMHLHNVSFGTFFNVSGMNQFRTHGVQIYELDLISSSASSSSFLTIQLLNFSMTNPSVMAPVINDPLSFQLMDSMTNPIELGYFTLSSLTLNCCGIPSMMKNGLVSLIQTPVNTKAMERLLSNFVSEYYTRSPEIQLIGTNRTSRIDILQPMLSQFHLTVPLPTFAQLYPSQPSFVIHSQLYWIPRLIDFFHLNQSIPIALELWNPFSMELIITGANLLLYPCLEEKEGKCQHYATSPLAQFHPYPFQSITIPPHTSSCYSCCQGQDCLERDICPMNQTSFCMNAQLIHVFHFDTILVLYHLLTTSGLLMYVNGTIQIDIGMNYSGTIAFQQQNLKVHL